MNEQTSWRGHSFTLLIFGGVVFLCSIFFILGMLAGRTQVDISEVVPIAQAFSEATNEEQLDLTFYESVDESEPRPLESNGTSFPSLSSEARAARMPLKGVTGQRLTLQIAALSSANQAEKLQEEVRGLDFVVFILSPSDDDNSGLHRVLVGPLSEAELEGALERLEAFGYKPIVRRR